MCWVTSRGLGIKDLLKSLRGDFSSQIIFEYMWELFKWSCNLSVCNFGVKGNESSRKMYGDQSVISQREEQGFLLS